MDLTGFHTTSYFHRFSLILRGSGVQGPESLPACGDGLGAPKPRNGAILKGELEDLIARGLEAWGLWTGGLEARRLGLYCDDRREGFGRGGWWNWWTATIL